MQYILIYIIHEYFSGTLFCVKHSFIQFTTEGSLSNMGLHYTRKRHHILPWWQKEVIWKHILFFSNSAILGNMLQQLYNTVDSIVVGNFLGSEALAAVGSSSSLIMLLISFSMGALPVPVSLSPSLSVHRIKRNPMSPYILHWQLHWSSALSWPLPVLFCLRRFFAGWAHQKKLCLNPSLICGFISQAWSSVFFIIWQVAFLNAVGNSKRALLYLAIASFTNIILDLLFIPVLKMGIAGAAIATDISQLLSAVLCMLYLMRVNESYKVVLRKIRIHKTVAIRIIQVGVPTAIQNTVISFANVLVQASVNSYGALAWRDLRHISRSTDLTFCPSWVSVWQLLLFPDRITEPAIWSVCGKACGSLLPWVLFTVSASAVSCYCLHIRWSVSFPKIRRLSNWCKSMLLSSAHFISCWPLCMDWQAPSAESENLFRQWSLSCSHSVFTAWSGSGWQYHIFQPLMVYTWYIRFPG